MSKHRFMPRTAREQGRRRKMTGGHLIKLLFHRPLCSSCSLFIRAATGRRRRVREASCCSADTTRLLLAQSWNMLWYTNLCLLEQIVLSYPLCHFRASLLGLQAAHSHCGLPGSAPWRQGRSRLAHSPASRWHRLPEGGSSRAGPIDQTGWEDRLSPADILRVRLCDDPPPRHAQPSRCLIIGPLNISWTAEFSTDPIELEHGAGSVYRPLFIPFPGKKQPDEGSSWILTLRHNCFEKCIHESNICSFDSLWFHGSVLALHHFDLLQSWLFEDRDEENNRKAFQLF